MLPESVGETLSMQHRDILIKSLYPWQIGVRFIRRPNNGLADFTFLIADMIADLMVGPTLALKDHQWGQSS